MERAGIRRQAFEQFVRYPLPLLNPPVAVLRLRNQRNPLWQGRGNLHRQAALMRQHTFDRVGTNPLARQVKRTAVCTQGCH
ncbi:MAG: hypothetical protein ACK56I_36185, partial [bacterium]